MIRIGGVGVNSSFLKYVCVHAYAHVRMYICVCTHKCICIFTCVYFLALSTERAWLPILCPPVAMNKDAPVAMATPGTQILVRITLPLKETRAPQRNGWGAVDARQACSTLLCQKVSKSSENIWGMSQGHRLQLKGAPACQIRDKLSTKIIN